MTSSTPYNQTGWRLRDLIDVRETEGVVATGDALIYDSESHWSSTAGQASTVAPKWDDLRVSLARTQAAASAPSFDVLKGAVRAWAFGTGEQLFFDTQLPHDARLGVAGAELRPHVHWSPGNNTDTGTVQWRLEVEWANPINEPDNEFATLAGSPLAVGQAGAGVAYRHQLASLGTVDASAMRASAVLMCRLYREASGDTFSGDAYALSVDWHYQRWGGGSADEF